MEPSVYVRSRLLAGGITDKELRRLCTRGELRLVRRGAYVRGAPPSAAEQRHLQLIAAELAYLSSNSIVSHASAAVLHGLPVWGQSLLRAHVTRHRGRSGSRRGARVHAHTAPIDPGDVVMIGGVPVTSLRRTLADIARSEPFEQAVVTTDCALHQHLVTGIDLADVLSDMRCWPGVPAARRAFAFSRPGAESVGESRSRVAMLRCGLPEPILQWRVGSDVCDFGWPDLRVAGEFDGRIKYGRLLRPGDAPEEAVYREKRREDRIRAYDERVVRWCWVEIDDFEPIARRILSR